MDQRHQPGRTSREGLGSSQDEELPWGPCWAHPCWAVARVWARRLTPGLLCACGPTACPAPGFVPRELSWDLQRAGMCLLWRKPSPDFLHLPPPPSTSLHLPPVSLAVRGQHPLQRPDDERLRGELQGHRAPDDQVSVGEGWDTAPEAAKCCQEPQDLPGTPEASPCAPGLSQCGDEER